MIVYLDTSAVVKLLLDEEGSDEAASLWADASIRVTSLLAYVETRAAVAAAERVSRLTAAQRRSALALLEDRWAELAVVAVDEAMIRSAGDLAQELAVRGYDAVHLASARALGDGGSVVFATWDRAQAAAASHLGLLVAPA